MAKAGRPKIDNPKAQKLSFRLDEGTVRILDTYCEMNNITRSEAIRIGVEALSGSKIPTSSAAKKKESSIPAFLL